MDPLRQRLPVEPDPAVDLAWDHHFTVEDTAAGEPVTQRVQQLGKIAPEFLAAA